MSKEEEDFCLNERIVLNKDDVVSVVGPALAASADNSSCTQETIMSPKNSFFSALASSAFSRQATHFTFALAVSGMLAFSAKSVKADNFNFDDVTAASSFGATNPGGPAGPTLVYPTVIFTGGVILNDAGFAGQETTTPNGYATALTSPLADGSYLPGIITAAFQTPAYYNTISLDVINGNYGFNKFTLTAYGINNAVVASETLALNPFLQSGDAQRFTVAGSGIDYFTITSDQIQNSKNFGIDTVTLTGAPVPEASTTVSFGLLLALGLSGLAVAARKKKVSA